MKKYAALIAFLALAAPHASSAAESLSFGDRGAGVTALQQSLKKIGYLSANATGYFGEMTKAAIQKFQCDKKIACSAATAGYGTYGPATQSALQVALAPKQPATITGLYQALTPAATGKFEVSGWLPFWRVASSTIDVIPHLNQLTSAMPFGYDITSEGGLWDTAKIETGAWDNFIAAAKASRTRVIPTVMSGDGELIHQVLSDPAKRAALEDSILAMVKKHGFDGVDIDLEAKRSETINYFSTFLKELYGKMGDKWVYCTVEARMPLEDRYLPGAKIPEDATEYANDYIAMNKYCDRVEIMAYDQGTVNLRLNSVRSAPYAPVADPGWVEDIVRLAAQTISRNKLIIGIPTYGYEYKVAPQGDGTFKYTRLWSFNPKYATDLALELGIAPHRTSALEIGFTYDSKQVEAKPTTGEQTQTQQTTPTTSVTANLGSQLSGNTPFNYVTWSDAQAIKEKIDLAKELKVRGVAFFSLNGGEDQGLWALLPSR